MDLTFIRLSLFIGVLLLLMLAEYLWPKRALVQGRRRWPANLSVVVIDTLLVRLLLPLGAVGAAYWTSENQIGLLNLLSLPPYAGIILAVVLLDLVIYWQHRLFHRLPLLWRLHQVHHADRDIDVTTALRFHPLEILLSALIKIVAVVLIGADALAVMLFEVVLNAMAMFNHANMRLPAGVDAGLRLLVITPDVHRIHHSVIQDETDSNYGFNLSLWDRIFGSWREQPERGHDRMTIGLASLQQAPTQNLLFMLRLPFARHLGQYPKPESATREIDHV